MGELYVEKKINFSEMNLYTRFVQHVKWENKICYVPWRILYDNFLFFVIKDTIMLDFENISIEVNEGELCIIPPFLKNRLRAKDNAEYYGIHFDFFYDDSEAFNAEVYMPEKTGLSRSELLEMPIEERLVHRDVYYPQHIQFPEKIRIHKRVELQKLMEKLLLNFDEKKFGQEMIMKSIFYEIMYMIIEEVTQVSADEELEQSEAFLRYIQDYSNCYEKKIDIAQMALEYGMSPNKFREYFCSIMKKTPKKYFLDYKMSRAKELLGTGRYQVSEVAYLLGYDDIFYFSKLFKRKEGVSPKKYMEDAIRS